MKSNRRIDELADQFEDAWNAGQRISADIFLAKVIGNGDSANWQELLDELRLVEQELHKKYVLTTTYVPTSLPRSPDDPLQRIGNYVFLELIGRGGMGELYRARHVLLDKIVAVKVLPEAFTDDPQAIKRFERELKLIGKLNHPNIVQAHGAELIDGKLLLIMEFVEGMNLHQYVNSGKIMPVDDALAIIRQVADGLQCAHEHKIIHRDIKPANIMVTPNGTAKILDFGLGKFHDAMFLSEHGNSSGPLTQMGSPLGTVDFLAPEQWDDPSSVDIRADIYGLGCTFYTIVVGHVPYPTSKYQSIREKMAAHFRQEPPSFSTSGVAVVSAVDAILQKMCAKDPNQRFTTPQELVDTIDKYRCDNTLEGKSSFYWRRVAAGIAVACVVGLFLLVMLDGRQNRSDSQSPEPNVGKEEILPQQFSDIFEAAQKGTVQDIEYFVKKDTDINARDNTGMTPLHIAARYNSMEVLEYLVSKGADLNAKSENGRTPLDIATTNEKRTFLQKARGQKEIEGKRIIIDDFPF